MKRCFQFSILFAMIFSFLPDSSAFVVDVKSKVETTSAENFSKEFNLNNKSKKEVRKLKRQNRKAIRMEKRFAKFQKKWEMRVAKKSLKKDKKRRRFLAELQMIIDLGLG